MHLQTAELLGNRLRHDDLNQSEPLRRVTTSWNASGREHIARIISGGAAARPVAAVKGITPQQPAPMVKEEMAPAPAPAAALPQPEKRRFSASIRMVSQWAAEIVPPPRRRRS